MSRHKNKTNKTNKDVDIDSNMITVNNFFAHWIKEISTTKYGSEKELPPTFPLWEVYQYSDQILKHLPSDALKIIQKTLLYSKKPVYFAKVDNVRKNYNSKDLTYTGLNAAEAFAKKQNHAKDLNIDDRISLFQEQLKDQRTYRIPLRYLSDIGKINFPTKIDYRIKLCLETKMEKLFESKGVLASTAAIPATNVQIIFTKAPFVQYEQVLLGKNFRQHLKTIMVSIKVLRLGAQKTPLQKTYEISKRTDSFNVEFLGSN